MAVLGLNPTFHQCHQVVTSIWIHANITLMALLLLTCVVQMGKKFNENPKPKGEIACLIFIAVISTITGLYGLVFRTQLLLLCDNRSCITDIPLSKKLYELLKDADV